MKTAIVIFFLIGALVSCNSDNHQRSERKISLVKEEPTYIKDRRLYGNIEKSVDVRGAAGPGSGGSYASGSYRQSALKASLDKQVAFPDSAKVHKNSNSSSLRNNKYFPPQKEANINYIDRWDKNLINKYDQPGSFPDTTTSTYCTWHPPFQVNMGSSKWGKVCSVK